MLLLCPSLQGAGGASAGIVRYVQDSKVWVLETERTSYVMGLDELGQVQNLYWGKKLVRDQDFSTALLKAEYVFDYREGRRGEEYPGWGGIRYPRATEYEEACLKVTLADGTRDVVLKYVSQEVSGNTLKIRLKDIRYDLFVDVTYQLFPKQDIIRKSARIENGTKQALVVESAQSGSWYVPPGDGYRLTYLPGLWGGYAAVNGEVQVTRESIHQGKKVLESRRGMTSHPMNPWFALDFQGQADEEHGQVWFGALAWSGNWKLVVEETPGLQVRVVGGYNDFDFGYQLKPGESLETPTFYGGFTERGFGEASRLMHRLERDEILPHHGNLPLRPVVFNSWAEAEAVEKQYAEAAAKLGVERFVVDDGWFGRRGHNDHASLGDWYPNPQMYPHGLKPLIDYVRSLGMEFGLWLDWESVNPDSDLYRRHPDWVINFPGRPRSEYRNQLVLNLAREDVKEYMFGIVDKLLTDNDIKMLKFDMNRGVSEPGWPEVPAAEQKSIWVKYVTNYYEILDRLRARHPQVELENSAGGGGRVDLAILGRMDTQELSDNGDAYDELWIGEGYTFTYAPRLLEGWVGDNPSTNDRSTSLKYRFLGAIVKGGQLGLGFDPTKWPAEEIAQAKKWVDYYKSIRKTLQEGELYRLSSPRDGNLAATEYVAPDGKQAVLFAFLHSQQFSRPAPPIYLRGLEDRAVYRLKPIDDKLREKEEVLSGSYLMNRGLNFNLAGDFDSTSIVLERCD
jgi:alpha-galactosidase